MSRVQVAISVAVVLVLGILWWGAYVQPYNALLDATNECVDKKGASTANRDAFNTCYRDLVGKAGGLVPFFHAP